MKPVRNGWPNKMKLKSNAPSMSDRPAPFSGKSLPRYAIERSCKLSIQREVTAGSCDARYIKNKASLTEKTVYPPLQRLAGRRPALGPTAAAMAMAVAVLTGL